MTSDPRSASPRPASLGPCTLSVHGGEDASRPGLGGTIERSSTFRLDAPAMRAMAEGRFRDALIYSRLSNPSMAAVESRLAAIEGAEEALLFASGMGAIHAALVTCLTLSEGEAPLRICASRDLYGGTRDLLTNGLAPLGIVTDWVDLTRAGDWERALERKPCIVYAESLSNPLLRVVDLPRIAEAAHRVGAKVIVDATFATPLGQRPLDLGCDLVCHSTTKYLGGHSDFVGGAVCGSRALTDEVWRARVRYGANADPEAADRLDRGLKTLALRYRAHEKGALAVAQFLSEHPAVRRVWHPSFTAGPHAHPDAELAGRVLQSFGGMLAFELDVDDAQATQVAVRMLGELHLFGIAASLGGVESLICLPETTSHAALTPEQRLEFGLRPGLIRVSV
ncbi:MAG: PLP-dependent transferase, partial [Planctomycetota bacterium]